MSGSTVEEGGLICAYDLDGSGGGLTIGWDEIRRPQDAGALRWIHLDYTQEASQRWLLDESGIPRALCNALLDEDTRPRLSVHKQALLLMLRGVNLNPGADPEDMVSVRLWFDERRIISLRRRRMMALQDIREALAEGEGPTNASDFLVALGDRLLDRMVKVIDELDDQVDELEDQILTGTSQELRTELADHRREAIQLRRYLAPQRDVMLTLSQTQGSWLGDVARLHIREQAMRTTRLVEDLDAARERAMVTHEELNSRLSEQTNRNMYLLSIVAAIFLPLGLITGVLGINVGGIPGADSPLGFTVVSLVLVLIVLAELWFFRRHRWL